MGKISLSPKESEIFGKSFRATAWAHHCGRPDLMVKSNEELHLNYYICSDHIEEKYFLSKTQQIIITQGAIPTLFNLQTHRIENDELKSTYSSADAMNSLELNDCQSNYVNENNYQEVMYNGDIVNSNEIDIHRNNDDPVNNNLNYENINVNIQQFHDVTMKLSNLCRICGRNAASGVDIFNDTNHDVTIQDKIQIHLPIIIENGDTMPEKICTDCSDKLDMFHGLVIISLQNDMRLRKLLNLPSKYNYEERFQSLIAKEELIISEEFFHGMVSSSSVRVSDNCELDENSERLEANDRESRLKYVFNSDFNNLIFQPLQLSNEEREKTNVPSEPIDENKASQLSSQELPNELINLQCHNERVLAAPESNGETTCIVLNNKQEIPNDNLAKSKPRELSRRCGHCSESFSNRKQLQLHITEDHRGEGMLFKCGICDKSYEKWSSLDVHEATHREDKPYLCDLCGKSFKHSNNLRGHKRVHLDITRKKRHVCEICGNAFRSRFHLREHLNQHDGNKPYACEQCGKAFSKRIQLRQHRLSHGVNKYSCTICGMTFNRRGNMNTHFKRHSNKDEMYTCSVCQCRCKSMSELKIHRKEHSEDDILESIKRKSTGKSVLQCRICRKIFSKRTLLLKHERTHEGDDMKIECTKCGKKLASESSLRHHVKTIHKFEKSHSCEFCGDEFLTKELRIIHDKNHSTETPYTCKLCNSEYKCSSNLKEHMRTHSSMKPYICRYCKKSFTRKASLKIHEGKHSDEKSLPRSMCDVSLPEENEMINHQRSQEFKIFECEKCNEKFIKKIEILKHLDTVHRVESRMPDKFDDYVEISQNFDNYPLAVTCPMVPDQLGIDYS